MTLQDVFHTQILAFHAAIMDDCTRAAGPEKTDAMALRLRNNALALGRLQMAMLAKGCDVTAHAVPPSEPEPAQSEPAQPEPAQPEPAQLERVRPEPVRLEPVRPEPVQPEPRQPEAADRPPAAIAPARPDRILTGDALSRFASRRLEAGESPHEIWQILQEGEPARQHRNPALPGTGFRSSSG